MGILTAFTVAILIGNGHNLFGSPQSESRTESKLAGQPTSQDPNQLASQTSSAAKQSAGGFDFTLEGCEPDGNDLRCRVLVTTKPETKRLMINNHSRLKVDRQSIEPYKLIKDTGRSYSTAIHFDVPAGEEVEFKLVFRGLKDVREATLLEVKCNGFSVSWNRPLINHQ